MSCNANSLWLRKSRKYGLIARTSLQNNLAYAANFMLDSLFYIFVVFIFAQLWRLIYRQGSMIAGYTLSQMIWYFIITEMITLSRSNVFEDLNQDIKNGNIAYYLNKPFHYVLYQGANGSGVIFFKLALNMVMGLVLGLILVGPLQKFPLGALPLMMLAFANGLVLNFLAMAALGLTAFWFEENTAFYWIYQKLTFMLGMFLPVEMLPGWAQRIALWLPFSYINYGPAKLVVDFSMERFSRIVTVQFTYIGVLTALVWLIFRKGVRQIHANGG